MTKDGKDKNSSGYLLVHNGSLYHELRSSIISPDRWNQEKGWATTDLSTQSKKLRATARIGPGPGMEYGLSEEKLAVWRERVAEYLLKLDDLNADLLDIICALYLMRCSSPEQTIALRADDIFNFRNIDGRTTKQKRELAERIAILSHTWVDVSEAEVIVNHNGQRQRTKLQSIKSRVLVVSSVAEEGHEPFAWKLRPGDVFMPFLFSPNKQLAILPRQILEWDPYRRSTEKRLARYLSWLTRIRQGKGEYLKPIRVGSILNAITRDVDARNPSRSRDRLELALDRIQESGVIRSWQYQEANETVSGQKGWWLQWQDWRLIIEPPQFVLDQYQTISVPEPRKALPQPVATDQVTLAITAMKEKRIAKCLSQSRVAEQLGISANYVAMIERGVKKPSQKLMTTITKWLQT
jgi:DNA-binding transcriptional regulator YiaG